MPVNALREYERWQDRQVDLYQRAEIVDRMGQQVENMSKLGRILAGVDTDFERSREISRDSWRLPTARCLPLSAIWPWWPSG
jgi:hypothetical protein